MSTDISIQYQKRWLHLQSSRNGKAFLAALFIKKIHHGQLAKYIVKEKNKGRVCLRYDVQNRSGS